jgi:VIT1/CCC1 family predicted Fe2+/Mn2+ transporter
MYLMAILIERGGAITVIHKIKQSTDLDEKQQVIREYLPPALAAVIRPEELGTLSQAVTRLPEPPKKAPITWKDIKAAGAIFLLVFLSTFPPAIPFIFIDDYAVAIRVSNAVAMLLLFLTGYKLGKSSGYNPLVMGLVFGLTGAVLVALTIALGG